MLRLGPEGTRHVAGWWHGAPVAATPGAQALARRLLWIGIAQPVPAGGPGPGDVTVVIPVRDRTAELALCLAGLSEYRVIVVDDGSRDPAAVAATATAAGAHVVRRAVNGGPAAARNTGLAAVDTPLVAFLDSDCVPAPGWLDPLLPHFADPAVAAAAPRIVPYSSDGAAAGAAGWLARYEGFSSTLDMGQVPSIVRPGSKVPYVPGAALVVRVAAAGAKDAGGFAEHLPVGEDVDFVLAAGRTGLARAVRAGRRRGPSAPGPAGQLVQPPDGVRHLRRAAGTAAPGHAAGRGHVRVERHGLGGRRAGLPAGRRRHHRRRDRPAGPAAGPAHRRRRLAGGHPAGRRRDGGRLAGCWAAPCPARGGRWRCPPRSPSRGCGCRWPR